MDKFSTSSTWLRIKKLFQGLVAGNVNCIAGFWVLNLCIFSVESAPPALGFSKSATSDPPEVAPDDDHLSDDCYDGPEEGLFDRPVEVGRIKDREKLVDNNAESDGDEVPKAVEKGDSIDDLLKESFEMDISPDSRAGSGAEGLVDEGVFDAGVPLSPIYRGKERGVIGSGRIPSRRINSSFYDSDDYEDVEQKNEAEHEVAKPADISAEDLGSGGDVSAATASYVPEPTTNEEADLSLIEKAYDLVDRGGSGPKEKLMTVGDVYDRDYSTEVSVAAPSDGGDVEGGSVGTPVTDPKELFAMIPALLLAPNKHMFERLLVSFSSQS